MSENSQELIRQYKGNDAEIKRLSEVRNEQWEKSREEERKIGHFYYMRIRKLEEKRDEATRNISSLDTQFTEVTDTKIENLNKVISKVKRIKVFLNMDTGQDLEIDDDKVKPSGRWQEDDYFEPLGYLINDDLLKVKLYVIENDRPKNKYTLIALGRCMFPEDILGWRSGYIHEINSAALRYPSIKLSLKYLSDVTELKEYAKTKREHLILLCKKNYDEVKGEYSDAIANYSLDDFKELEEASR